MKTKICIAISLLLAFGQTQAQQFIDKAVIEYEVKTNIKKTMGNSSWDEQLKDAIRNGKGSMPAFGKLFSDAELQALVRQIRSFEPSASKP